MLSSNQQNRHRPNNNNSLLFSFKQDHFLLKWVRFRMRLYHLNGLLLTLQCTMASSFLPTTSLAS